MRFWKKTVSALLIALMCIITIGANAVVRYEMVRQGSVGETVQRVQMRLSELDYLHFKPTGSFRGMTVSATIAFQRVQETEDGNWVAADGEAGEQTQSILFSPRARRAAIPANAHMPIGPSLKGSPKFIGKIESWANIKEKLSESSVYKLIDYNTGDDFKVRYLGGEGHAEVECVSMEDTAVFLEVFGNEFNYSKRAVVLQLDTETFIAASLFGFPHGDDKVADNDMKGHACLFFDGSFSHVGKITDVEHQKQIYTAAGT